MSPKYSIPILVQDFHEDEFEDNLGDVITDMVHQAEILKKKVIEHDPPYAWPDDGIPRFEFYRTAAGTKRLLSFPISEEQGIDDAGVAIWETDEELDRETVETLQDAYMDIPPIEE